MAMMNAYQGNPDPRFTASPGAFSQNGQQAVGRPNSRIGRMTTRMLGMQHSNPAKALLSQRIDRLRGRRGLAPMNQSGAGTQPVPGQGGQPQPGAGNPFGGLPTGTPPTGKPNWGGDNQPVTTMPVGSPTPAGGEANSGLFPSSYAMTPQNYQGSPMYDWRLKQGQKALDRVMARSGLLKSGAEIDANQDMVNQLSGEEAQIGRQISQQEADRLERMQGAESGRLERQGNSQWGRMMDMLNYANANSPMQYAYGGMGSLGDLYQQWGNTKAGRISDQYPRYSKGVGGFSGQPLPEWQAPFPGGPDMSLPNYYGIQNNYGLNNDLMSIFNNVAGSFLA